MNVMDISNEDTMPGKGSTPKILFKRPGSRDINSGGFPGLRLINNFNAPSNRNGFEKPQTADEQLPPATMGRQSSTVMLRPNNYELQRLGSRENQSMKMLAPIGRGGGGELLSREVDKEIGSMQVQQRLRDLESMIIDLKGNTERRLQKIQDEQPGKFMANFKRLEDKEGQYWKDNNQKQSMINDQYSIVRETMRKQNEQNGQQLLELQRKIDEVSFQNHRLQKNQEQLQVIIKNGSLNNDITNGNSKKNYDPQEGQLALLKEQFNQELRIRENAFEDLNKNYLDLQRKVFEQEKDFMSKMQKQRDTILEETQVHKQQLKQLEGVKMDKLLGDNDYLKQLIDQVERRLENEMDKRLKQEFESKAYFEQKMNLFKDEVRNDEKAIIEGEQKFVKQMNESIQSIHQIIKFTKEELEANLASTQTLFAESIKGFGQQMEVIRENVDTKMALLERGYKDLNGKVNETRVQFQEHANTVQAQVDRQSEQIERTEEALRQSIEQLEKETRDKVAAQERQNELWKDTFEKKNLAIFQEISSAMKGLKQDMLTERKEGMARIKDLREELTSYQQMNEKLLQNLKDHVDRAQESTDFKIAENDREIRDTLVKAIAEVDKTVRELDDGIFMRGKEFTLARVAALADKIATDISILADQTKNDLERSTKKLKKDLEEQISEQDKLHQERVRIARQAAEDQNDKTLKIIEADKKDLFEYKNYQKDQLKNLRSEALDDLRKAMDDVKLEIQSKIDIEHKQQEMALAMASRQLQRQIEESSAKSADDLARTKEEIITKFRQELDEIVLKRLLAEIQQEKNERIRRESEIETSMHNIKNMLLEALHQKVESAKALARALVTEEAAERAKNDEEILKFMKDGLDALDRTLKQLIKTSIEECMYILRQEIAALEEKLNAFKEWTMKEFKKIQDELKDWKDETRAENYLRDQYQRLRDQEMQEVIGKVEFELVSVKKTIEENLLLLINEINVRQEEQDRMDNILEDHENRLVDHNDRLVVQRDDFEKLKKNLSEISDTIKESIQKQRTDFEKFKAVTTQNVEYLENEVNENMTTLEGQAYLDKLTMKVQIDEILGAHSSSQESLNELYQKLQDMINQVNENFKQQEIFEEKTEKNFKIAEKAIKSHSNFLNSLDARLYFEELAGQLSAQDLQKQQALMHQQIQNNILQINDEINKAMEGLQQDNNNKLDDIEKITQENQEKLDQHAQQLEDHQESLGNYVKQLGLVETDLRATEAGINSKIEEVVNSVNENINQFNAETSGFKEEINTKLTETNGRIDEVNGKVDNISNNLVDVHEKIEGNTAKQDQAATNSEDLKAQIDEMNQKNTEINEKIDAFNAKSDEFQQKSEEAEQKLAGALEKADAADQRVEQMAAKIDELLTKQDEEAAKVEEQAAKMEEQNQKIEELTQKLEDMGQQQEKNQNDSKKDDEENKASVNEELAKMKEEIDAKLEEMNEKVEVVTVQIQEKEKNIEDLGNDIHIQIERIDALEEAENNKKDPDSSKQQQEPNESMQKKMEAFEEEIQDLKQQMEQMKTEELEQIKAELEQQVKRLEEQIEDIQNKGGAAGASANVSKDKAELQEMQQELNEAKQDAQEAKQEAQDAKQDAEVAKQEVEEVKPQVEEIKQSIEEIRTELEENKAQIQAAGEALEEVKEIDNRIQAIEQRLADLESK